MHVFKRILLAAIVSCGTFGTATAADLLPEQFSSPVDSAWYLYLPARGTLLISQTENYWDYLREIVVPAHWDSGHAWKGDWRGTITSGPGESGTARVYGGSGAFDGMESDALETLAARAYSAEVGPVAMQGLLTIEIPDGGSPPADNELAALDAD